MKIIGVYAIFNKVNGKIYVGKSKNIKSRFISHRSLMNSASLDKKRCNKYLWYSCKKYGIESFEFAVLQKFDYFDNELLSDAELFWIDFYDSTNRELGYNLRRDSSSNMIVHSETCKLISERLKIEWANGVRDNHSEKVKLAWDFRNRKEQSDLFSSALTKYQYILTDSLGNTITCLYQKLQELKLSNVLSKFKTKGCDVVQFKGFNIERVKLP